MLSLSLWYPVISAAAAFWSIASGPQFPFGTLLVDSPPTNHPSWWTEWRDTTTRADSDSVVPPLLGASLRYGVDTTISPCVDFYRYVNGAWRTNTKLPPPRDTARPRGVLVNFFSDTYHRLHERSQIILDSARTVAITTTDPALKALGHFYASCLTTDSLERPGQRGGAFGGVFARPSTSNPTVKDSTRREQCVQRTVGRLGGALAQVVTQEILTVHALTRMHELLAAIHAAAIERIQANPWMTTPEKTASLERLRRLQLRVGMPKDPVDYRSLVLSSSDYWKNTMEIASFEDRLWVNSIGADVSQQWKKSLLRANASYLPKDHAIEVPPLLFMVPFFDTAGEDALNFAGIGMIIAHEIFHSLSWAGELSRLENPAVAVNVDRLKTLYSGLGTVDDWTADGSRSFSENVADLGGILVAYQAWQTTVKKARKPLARLIDGYTPEQRFFIAVARLMRAKWQGTELNKWPHSPPFARVNGLVRQLPEFAQAFGCKEGDPMVLPEEQRPLIW